MGAYDDAARAYLAAGWSPIPVLGKTMPARGTTGYEGTVTAEKVEAWLTADLTQRARNGRGVNVDNVGLRHQFTLAIDVDHGYGDKDGVTQLAAWAAKLLLPPLPATWSSTARGDDSPSRQYLYRIAEDVVFKTKPCVSVELCCWHHRFTVCAPTIHPGTGTPYTWYQPGLGGVPPTWGTPTPYFPRPTDLPYLPAEWMTAFRGGVANADRSVAVVDLPELMATFPEGEPDGLVRYLIAKWSDEAQHCGHDEAKNALINCFMVGREGHPGVDELYSAIVDRYITYLQVARPAAAEAEVRALVAACAAIAQQKPITLTVRMGYANAHDFLIGRKTPIETHPTHLVVDTEPGAGTGATADEVNTFLASYTRYARPDRLGRRGAWMQTDPPHQLLVHAHALVIGAFAGEYPADRALRALTAAYEHHGGTDPHGARSILSNALGAILDSLKVGA